MFTQNIFIRKNTPLLISKLEELGWRKNTLDDFKLPWLAANYGMFISVDEGFERLHQEDIDCGTNEEVFLALAALRDDTDVNQWFIMDVDAYTDLNKGDWIKATDINGKFHIGTKIDPNYCHKATVEEILKYFSK